jgi:hypothetical protein
MRMVLENAETKRQARLATLAELEKDLLPNFLSPVPTRETLRDWFDAAGIARLKANPHAKRGGGPTYYSVSGVEKFLRGRVLPGRVRPPGPRSAVTIGTE